MPRAVAAAGGAANYMALVRPMKHGSMVAGRRGVRWLASPLANPARNTRCPSLVESGSTAPGITMVVGQF
jgi:hypothetical protein